MPSAADVGSNTPVSRSDNGDVDGEEEEVEKVEKVEKGDDEEEEGYEDDDDKGDEDEAVVGDADEEIESSMPTIQKSAGKRPRESRYELFASVLNRMSDAILARMPPPPHELHAAVYSLEGYSEEDLDRALDWLIDHDCDARTFMVRSTAMRNRWITRFLGSKA